jgi:tetratricopeptide (TPR) repeat protein
MRHILSWKVLLALGALALTAGGGWAAYRYFHPSTNKGEYAELPFTPVSKEYPRIFLVREVPHDRQAAAAFWKDRKATREQIEKTGALAHASEEERQAYKAAAEEDYVKARELAENVLIANPDSIAARFVMAKVQRVGERNPPRALFEVREARYRLEKIGQANPNDADAREWYMRVLDLEEGILGDMDRREEQLQALALLEQVYQPMPWARIFPLIKLKRADEASRLLDEVEKEGTWPMHCLNERFMLANLKKDYEEAYRLGKQMTQKMPHSGVLWSNFGNICLTTLRPEEAEAAYTKSATGAAHDFNSSAFMKLAGLNIAQGRFQEAWAAIKNGQRERGQRDAYTLQQDQSVADRCIAELLLATGLGAAAERFARRAWDRPRRLGSNTGSENEETYANAFLLREVLRTRIEELREDEARTGGLIPSPQREALALEVWTLEKQIVREFGDTEFVQDAMLPSAASDWTGMSLLGILPAGVAVEMQRQARALLNTPNAEPYFDAHDAALALRAGRKTEALEAAKRALEKLPLVHERLVRARVAAIGAEAARGLGRVEEYRSLANQGLRDCPEVFRMVDVAIPVCVSDDGSPLAHKVAQQLLRSPRFRDDPDGFSIQVRRTGDQLAITLDRLHRDRHCLVEVAVTANEDETAATAYRRFHERMMSPTLELGNTDIFSVDGAPAQVPTLPNVILHPPGGK